MRRALLVIATMALALHLGATVASAHDCSSPADCEETGGYIGTIGVIGGIIAIIVAILGTDLGSPGTTRSDTKPEQPPVTAAPPIKPVVVWDPFNDRPLPQWDPKFQPGENGNPGQPGWVWWGGNWRPPDEAIALIDNDVRVGTTDPAVIQAWKDAGEKATKDLADKRAQEAQDEKDRREAADLLEKIRETARNRGDDDVWTRTLDPRAGGKDGSLYDENGNLRPDKVKELRDAMVNHIDRTRGEPDKPPRTWFGGEKLGELTGLGEQGFNEFTAGTWDGVRRNPITRIVAGVATGGASEVVFAGQTAWDGMVKHFDELEKQGKTGRWDFTEAIRAGTKGVIDDMAPTNTINTLRDPTKSWGDVAISIGADGLAVFDLGDTARNIGAGIKTARGGGSLADIIKTRADPLDLFGKGKDPSQWPGVTKHVDDVQGVVPRDLKNIPDGQPMRPHDVGMGVDAGRHARDIAGKYGVDIDVRPANPDAIKRLGEGDLPKPPHIKAKTINEIDELIGAPKGEKGRVGVFEPTKPANFDSLEPNMQKQIESRIDQRAKEFAAINKDLKVMQASGDIRIERGGVLVDGQTGKAFTGDLDVFQIKDPGGRPLPPEVKAQVINELKKPPFNAQHGAHTDWKYDPLDSSHGEMNSAIDQKVRDAAADTPNVRFGADGSTTAAKHLDNLERAKADAARIGDVNAQRAQQQMESTQVMSREQVERLTGPDPAPRFGKTLDREGFVEQLSQQNADRTARGEIPKPGAGMIEKELADLKTQRSFEETQQFSREQLANMGIKPDAPAPSGFDPMKTLRGEHTREELEELLRRGQKP